MSWICTYERIVTISLAHGESSISDFHILALEVGIFQPPLHRTRVAVLFGKMFAVENKDRGVS